MKQFKQLFLIKIFLLGIFNLSEAQTLNYTTVNYPTSLCNVFNVSPARVVSGLTHYPVSGGVSYNGSALVLQTKGGQTLSTTLGTAYAIAIPIKQGFIYNITVNASKQSQDPVSAPSLEIGAISSLPNPNTTNPTACGAVDQNKWSVLQSATIGFAYVNRTTSQNYPVVQNFTPNTNLSYLTILAHSGSQSQTSTVLINSITITETAAVSFTLAPTSLNIQCGSTTPQTFTVTNVNNIQGVTNHLWNLGSATNGWLYNGSAAPSTISTGATNTLTLTPVCGSIQSNVSATAAVGASNYNTNVATISVVPPTLSIAGNSPLCSGSAVYSVANLPACGSIVTDWSATPSGIVSVVDNGNNTATITKLADGQVTVTATVNLTNPCNTGTINLSFPLSTAAIELTGYYTISSNYHQPIQRPLYTNNSPIWLPANQSFGVTAYITNPNIPSPSWTRAANSVPLNWSSSGVQLTYSGMSGSTAFSQRNGIFVFTANTGCGATSTTYTWPVIVQGSSFKFTTAPNPAKDNLTVSLVDQSPEVKALSKNETVTMTLYDLNSTTAVKIWTFKNSQTKFNANIRNLKKGHYILKVQKGNYQQSEQIIIE